MNEKVETWQTNPPEEVKREENGGQETYSGSSVLINYPKTVEIDGETLRPCEVYDYKRWAILRQDCPARRDADNSCRATGDDRSRLCLFRRCLFRHWRGYV